MDIIYQVIKTLLLANLITSFAPIGWILELLPKNMFKWILILLTSCLKCCSFWCGLVITGDLFIAAGIYFGADVIQKIKEKIWSSRERIR